MNRSEKRDEQERRFERWRPRLEQARSDASAEDRQRASKGLDEWRDLIHERIEQAREQGAFNNLPGAGRPLDLAINPNEPPELRMAHKLLADNDLAPSWIGDRKGILADVEQLRREMEQEWRRMRRNDTADRERLARSWARTLTHWEERITALNGRIRDLNLSLPIWRMELLCLRLDDELERIGASRRLDVREL